MMEENEKREQAGDKVTAGENQHASVQHPEMERP
jgi:hypothetical protein